MTDEPDEWTPRERGVMAGRDYAEEVGRGTLTVRDEHNEPMPPDVLLRHAAEDSPRIPAAIGQLVQEHLGERFAASEDPTPNRRSGSAS
jgi:hypothetical protein